MEKESGSTKKKINEELKRTEIGSWIEQNKVFAISVIVVLLLSIVSWGIYNNHMEDVDGKYSNIIYQFTESEYKNMVEKKIDSKSFITAFKLLAEKTDSFKGLVPVLLKSADHLRTEGQLDDAAVLLEDGYERFADNNSFVDYFISIRLATIYEDLNQEKKAVKILEKLNLLDVKLVPGKNHLDLGRLYMQLGDMDKATENLKNVISKDTQDDFVKMAKLYLNEIEIKNANSNSDSNDEDKKVK